MEDLGASFGVELVHTLNLGQNAPSVKQICHFEFHQHANCKHRKTAV
jgi:hypothetical protein